MQRGIIATASQFNINSRSEFSVSSGLTASEIRYFILYWDKIIIPTNNLIHVGVSDEEDLISANIIERPRVQLQGSFDGADIAHSIIQAESIIVDNKLKDKSTDWVVHQFSNHLFLPNAQIKEQNIFKFELANALPVPHDDVSIHEIIEFKDRRKDEFNALHNSLDSLYMDILASPDSDLKAKKSMKVLQDSLLNIEKVQKEKFKIFTKFDRSLDLKINGKDIFDGLLKGGAIDLATGMQLPIATIIGAISPMINISFKKSKTFSQVNDNLKLAYLSNAKKEKIIL